MRLKPTVAKAFIQHNYFTGNAPTDEFVRERLAREFAMEILKRADFTRVDTAEGAQVTASVYIATKAQLDSELKSYFELGYKLAYEEMANSSHPE